MPILSLDHLVVAEELGLILIKDRLAFNPFSLDIRLGKIYRKKEGAHFDASIGDDALAEKYIEKCLEEIAIPKDGLLLEPFDPLFWQPKEIFALATGISAYITSRSSYARLGLMTQVVYDMLRDDRRPRAIRPLCMINPLGTKVMIRQDEPMGQIIFMTDPGYVSHGLMKESIRQGDFKITRGEETTTPLSYLTEEIERQIDEIGAVKLTVGQAIKIYNGKTLVPEADNTSCFDEVEAYRARPLRLPEGTFYISASEEAVEIPEWAIGDVSMGFSMMSLDRYRKTGDPQYRPRPILSHPNAPFIGPKNVFKGVITFENTVFTEADGIYDPERTAKRSVEIYRGMTQSFLHMRMLSKPVTNAKESSYKGQKEATLSLF